MTATLATKVNLKAEMKAMLAAAPSTASSQPRQPSLRLPTVPRRRQNT